MKIRDPKRKKFLEWRRDGIAARRQYDLADDWIRPKHLKMEDTADEVPPSFHLPLPERHERKKLRRDKNQGRGSFYVKGPWRWDRGSVRPVSEDFLMFVLKNDKKNRKFAKLRADRSRKENDEFLSKWNTVVQSVLLKFA